MRARTLLATAITTASAAAPVALGLEAQPLPQRVGVVVGFEADPGIATVALPDGKLLAVHTSRNAIWRPGTRVRLEGISWGAPTEGIKWATAPPGVRTAIQRAANGTYASRLTRVGRTAGSTIRGTVAARVGGRTLAVTVPGATLLVPLAAQGGIKLSHAATLPAIGSTVAIPVAIDARGRLTGRRVRVVHRAVAGAAVPLAGRVSAIDAARRTLRLRAGRGAQVISFRIAVPPTFDLAAYRVGQALAVTAVPAPDGSLAARTTALNGTFAQADDPAGVQTLSAPAPATPAPGVDPADLQTVELMRLNWSRAVDSGLITDPGVAQAGATRIAAIHDRIFGGLKADAIGQLTAFIGELAAMPAGAVPPDVRDRESQLAAALRTHLGG
ncbi:MAG TPA: hypothetical protein VKD47_00320 [Miltoncostaeaceae bacterium]|nr:hypothetical protein [Miltoncostaeaceae bacterium]